MKAEVNKLRLETKKLKSASASEKEADLMEEAASVWVCCTLFSVSR
jgi:E3 ubiquitin-protein ligase BRE1